MAMYRSELPANFTITEDNCGNVVAAPHTVKAQMHGQHPVERTLKNSDQSVMGLKNSVMLEAFGPSGPMIHMMELKAARSVGRLPFLQSSHAMVDALTGRDMEIDFMDVFSGSEYQERLLTPHKVMDYSNVNRSGFTQFY